MPSPSDKSAISVTPLSPIPNGDVN
ncbi:uncharacterized protein G2W53_001059 [Senna tora]|uniref:Uncharacterized protein n=1 Tax=Senna tora TaxID=362788 RepID=A0A835CJ30_9FABA|nr:uncharacterized protein G2W53_001059 [Senna tora]